MTKKSYKQIVKLAVVTGLVLASSVSLASEIVLGSDYFHTVSGMFLGNNLVSRANGLNSIRPAYAPLPSGVDTIVERQGDCTLNSLGDSCAINIEVVGLSLQTLDGLTWIREDADRVSSGQMTIDASTSFSNTGISGMFSSVFDVFTEVSTDFGLTWIDTEIFFGVPTVEHFSSIATWSTVPSGPLFTGLVGNQDANYHTNKNTNPLTPPLEFDFFVDPEQIILHTAPTGDKHRVQAVPTPPTVFLMIISLFGLFGTSKKRLS